jgi:hypothetical protein
MKRRWNLSLWLGFLIVLATPFAYLGLFIPIPAIRDFPWPTLVMFGAGLGMTALGLKRAYGEPERYRGKIAGPILAVLGLALTTMFIVDIFFLTKNLPPSSGAPKVGQEAPDFTLPDQDGRPVTLSQLVAAGAGTAGSAGVVLVFYRGYW